MTAATKHERLLSCLVSDSAYNFAFSKKKLILASINLFIYNMTSCINYVNR